MQQLWGLLGAAFLFAALTETALAQSGSLRVGANGVAAEANGGSVDGRSYAARNGQSNEILLPDGTSVVIGSGGSFRVDRFDWDGQSGTGVLTLSSGTFRISAGALGRSGSLRVFAGSSQLDLEGATVVVSVTPENSVTAYMTVGGRVTVSAQGGCTRRLSRAGFATQTEANGCPNRATRVAAARLSQDRAALRPVERVAAGRSNSTSSTNGLLIPAGGSSAPATTRRPPAQATETVAQAINSQVSGAQQLPQQFALNLAPGINVPGATSPNVTGSPVTAADGRFTIFDAGLIPASGTIDDAIGPPIFESRAGDVYFSNSDAQPVAGGQRTGDFSFAFRYVNTISELMLDPFEVIETVTVADAIAQEQSGFIGDVVNKYRDELDQLGTPFSFLTLDLNAAGLSLSTELGEEASIEYTPISTSLTQFNTLSSPYDDKLGAGFTRSNGLLELEPGGGGFGGPTDGFVLFHTADAAGVAVDPDGQSQIFATGAVSGGSSSYFSFRVEQYESSFGLFDLLDNGAVPWPGYLPKRALLPDLSRTPGGDVSNRIALNDTGVYFVYAPQNTDDPIGTIAQVVQADMGFLGAGADQRSTLSISTGSVDRGTMPYTDEGGNTFNVLDYSLKLHSLGSLRDSPQGFGSVLVSSPLTTLAFGGDNENLSGGFGPISGLAGYFLVATDDSAAAGSTFLPMNPNAASADFQTVRFLHATGYAFENGTTNGTGQLPDYDPTDRQITPPLTGYAAGLAEAQLASGTLAISPRGAAASGPPNFALSLDDVTNRVTASMTLADPNGASFSIGMGGNSDAQAPLSAYVDQRRFAARSNVGADGLGFAIASSALVLGEPFTQNGMTTRVVSGLGSGAGTPVRDYDHVKWGVFLGDRIASAAPQLREHIHAGSWVAGDPVNVSEYVDFTGTAVYTGHAIGNAFDGAAVYTAIGTITNTWDFGAGGGNGTGAVTMTFDNSTYTGSTTLKAGGGFESADLSAPDRAGRLSGEFFGGVSTVGAVTAPNAMGGQFDLSNTAGTPIYSAAGTFAAEKQ